MSRSKRNAKADEYFRRAPNYSAEAIPDLRLWSRLVKSQYPLSSKLAETLADDLESAHKFALPHGGRLFEGGVSDVAIEEFHPPFEKSAFEFCCEGLGSPEDKFHTVDVPFRIALCVDVKAAFERQIGELVGQGTLRALFENSWLFKEPAATIWTVNWVRGRWVPGWCGAVIPYKQEPVPVTKSIRERVLERMTKIGAKAGTGAKQHSIWRMTFLPFGDFGLKERSRMGTDEAEYAMSADTSDEVVATMQACAALSCTNVTTELIRPNREARAARPESTLFDYHVLMIRPGAERHEGNPLGGSHASPRTHLRRGHIRQHPTAGRIWVNSCVVNPTAIGTVNKDYRIVV